MTTRPIDFGALPAGTPRLVRDVIAAVANIDNPDGRAIDADTI
jgi:hypothetical protein